MEEIVRYYNKINKNKNKKNYISLLHWPSKERQLKEFKILSKIITKKHYSILDYGCGTGDLIYFLKTKPQKYVGLDINNKFIKIGKKRFGNKKYSFFNSATISKDIITDYTISCGAFSIKGSLNEKEYDRIMNPMLMTKPK